MTVNNQYLTVTALTKYIHRKFSADPYLQKVYLTGEISNFRIRPRHQYFSLKDETAKIDAIMFEGSFKKLKFKPESGMKVLVCGRIDLYEGNGNYQIIIEDMQPDGIGALYQAYEQLKEKLANEGLFNAPKKKLVKFPRRIAVITSPSGAVIRDIITTTKRRYPIAQLVLFPAVVQGNQAAPSLVGRLTEINKRADFDTIIIGRGGGSIEDLWPFNEESVARAIAASHIPVISSVGHETDTTIADLVADVRAATPTAAAELATPVLSEEVQKIRQNRMRIWQSCSQLLKRKRESWQRLQQSYVFTQPKRLYENYEQRLDILEMKQKQALKDIIHAKRTDYETLQNKLQVATPISRCSLAKQSVIQIRKQLILNMKNVLKKNEKDVLDKVHSLEILSPLKVMGRGFSYVTTDENEAVVKRVADLKEKQQVKLHLVDGIAKAEILEIIKEEEK